MRKDLLENHADYIDFLQFQNEIIEELNAGSRFCFIIGSGASTSSGIPTGREMVNDWLKDLKEGHNAETYREDISKRIQVVLKNHLDDPNIDQIEKSIEKYKDFDCIPDLKSSQDDYNYIYELRFAYDESEGKKYFLEKSDTAFPNVGYMSLANILCHSCNNLVVTTNFDELIEIATFTYQRKKAFSIEHETLAKYALENWSGRPRILKIHQGVAFGGLNKANETRSLKKEWK